ncbi:hypothetical protein DET52_10368 [Sunxiuqinia elliptica]|uniref:Uncharacterized protein n=1 Tax=Sunxiuqinia elliptica TaxID=655355 RepID=A0A4V6PRV0_9BACT|nr:hypothetical protein [Sunxiuqinia elliptica]TDO03129.1 hypothetical protein DET52_10368 [Sunxiuqinia elliptica]
MEELRWLNPLKRFGVVTIVTLPIRMAIIGRLAGRHFGNSTNKETSFGNSLSTAIDIILKNISVFTQRFFTFNHLPVSCDF